MVAINGYSYTKPHQLLLLIFYCQFHQNIAWTFFWLFSQDIQVFKRDHFLNNIFDFFLHIASFTFKALTTLFLDSNRIQKSLSCKGYKCLYVLFNIIKKKAVLPKMPLCLSSVNFHIMHVRVFFVFFSTFCSRKADNNLLVKL